MFSQIAAKISGTLHQNLVKVFWFNKTKNAGDLVTPFLLTHYGFTPVHAWPQQATLFGCGSILKHLFEEYRGYIIGSGFFWEGDTIYPSKASILAVRGKTTWQRLGSPQGTLFGDPGFLMGRYVKNSLPKQASLGLIPHYAEKNHPAVQRLIDRYPHEIRVIDIQQDPLTVTEQITTCEYVLSSSLHGCIFADSLHLPRVWMMVDSSDPRRSYKFNDYISPFNAEINPMLIKGDESLSEILAKAVRLDGEAVDRVANDMDACFRRLQQELLGSQLGGI